VNGCLPLPQAAASGSSSAARIDWRRSSAIISISRGSFGAFGGLRQETGAEERVAIVQDYRVARNTRGSLVSSANVDFAAIRQRREGTPYPNTLKYNDVLYGRPWRSVQGFSRPRRVPLPTKQPDEGRSRCPTPLRCASCEVVGSVNMLVAITDRKRAEENAQNTVTKSAG
jgi:hypothetical protein